MCPDNLSELGYSTPQCGHLILRPARGVMMRSYEIYECTCLDCAHSWTAENRSETIECPNCGRPLQVETDRMINAKYSDHFAVVTRCNCFQVVRMYLVKTILRKGEKAKYSFLEAFQRWIDAE